MGSPCELRLYGAAPSEVAEAAEVGIAEVARLERKYSRYRDDSLTTSINRSAGDPDGVCVDAETAALLDYADVSFQQSGGLFDITSGILRRVWDFKAGRLPAQDELDDVRKRIGWEKVRWERPRLVLPLEGMELDFGGYVKEYAADRVAELCRSRGIRHGLVDLGGDLSVLGPHPDGTPWRVGVRDPRRPDAAMASVALAAGAIASSGDYERFMVVDGKRYGHILNPKTGWPVEGLAGVSVVASHCLIAGTAATIAMLKGVRDGVAWLEELGLPHVRVDRSGAIGGTLAAQMSPVRAITTLQ
jgi:thiamine biosynthesis lipoprotein